MRKTESGATLRVDGVQKLAETYALLNQVINAYSTVVEHDVSRFKQQGTNDIQFDKQYASGWE
ncbi:MULTISPECIES: hypothetical protein [Lacticaseibacillus]|uniref:Uncharacterized protein n=2 Tax=Lacticaseibacillus TaxID=2759736 RepID=A0AAN1EZW2_LACCA|nr:MULTISPECIES: hypothetical protein [Lacticaseibacillus]ARY92224.1 hypothetical protein BGL52_10855 [Lacticaseibacillus casei]KAB1971275.1 hypothetical protein F9B82_01965 [Lacticaseibacillus casei]WLV80131.1 hypothetical protein LACSTY_002182 [Lacticaseibacillus sp. NCIMB 15473]WNX24090.1 hypothetical protein RWA15_10630 [Lacticaseibacillus casei]WNX26864.1 hypothetical protein RWA16_10635 [Lacticaseibacillus casei]